MALKEHIFTELVTYEHVMWRKSYVSGTIRAVVNEIESDTVEDGESGKGRLVEIASAQRLRLCDDYTDLHGGIDCLSRSATLEEVKKMVEGKEGTFMHHEKSMPPTHRFTLKDQFPLDVKPAGLPFG